jgi:hypothetical protein
MHFIGRAMAQAVSRRPVTVESRVRSRFTPCEIYGGQSGTGTGFSPSFSVLHCKYHSSVALHTHISSAWKIVFPLVAAVQKYRHTSTCPTTIHLIASSCFEFAFETESIQFLKILNYMWKHLYGDSSQIPSYGINTMPTVWNVAVERLTLLLRIREVPGSNTGTGDRKSSLSFSCFFSVPPVKFRESTLKLGHDRFLPNPLQFIITYHPIINAISLVTEKAL